MSINDWLEVVAELIPELETLTQAGETKEKGRIRAKLPWLTGGRDE